MEGNKVPVMKRVFFHVALAAGILILCAAGAIGGATYYYTSQRGAGCAGCHEMADYVGAVHASSHRSVGCFDCHSTGWAAKLRHTAVHLSGRTPEAIRLRDVDVVEMTAKCQSCHQREYATWRAGPHSATYAQIFTNAQQNATRRLMDDCFRCHGMQFSGSIGDIVQPQSLNGPWRIVRAGLASEPTMPCQACHWIHREGLPVSKPVARFSVAGAADGESLAFFDRREQMHFAIAELPLPQIFDRARPVNVSPDQRQALCYQCHAPRQPDAESAAARNNWGAQAGSGDDRTPLGVHEGISCFTCHSGHGESTRASCATCHPVMSDCGLAVEKMDTTYANPASKHNIHWVKCQDCHTHGVPRSMHRGSEFVKPIQWNER